MANQKVIKIVNIKRSPSADKKFEQEMYETLWLKKEDNLRADGWLPESEIKEVKIEKVEDGKGKKTVEVVEEEVAETETEKVEEEVAVDYSKMKVGELRAELEAKGIMFHADSKKAKLIELLNENK